MTRANPISFAPAPQPRGDRRGLSVALGLVVVGLTLLALLLCGAWRGLTPAASAPLAAPPPIVIAGTPIASTASALATPPGTIVAPRPGSQQARAQRRLFAGQGATRVPSRWEAGFYGIYATAQHTFAVNWLLLASIHKQETAFSTAPSTYRGLNFAHCCAGPMQFNVTNRPVSTWALVMGAYRFGARPAVYNHATVGHPSIYDDFDAIMAAAWLVSSDGAGMALDDAAWNAAYDYYGHDATGVIYADQVLARAIGWSQTGFCINCTAPRKLVDAVHAAYGAPVLAQLAAPAAVGSTASGTRAGRAPAVASAGAPRAVAAGTRRRAPKS